MTPVTNNSSNPFARPGFSKASSKLELLGQYIAHQDMVGEPAHIKSPYKFISWALERQDLFSDNVDSIAYYYYAQFEVASVLATSLQAEASREYYSIHQYPLDKVYPVLREGDCVGYSPVEGKDKDLAMSWYLSRIQAIPYSLNLQYLENLEVGDFDKQERAYDKALKADSRKYNLEMAFRGLVHLGHKVSSAVYLKHYSDYRGRVYVSLPSLDYKNLKVLRNALIPVQASQTLNQRGVEALAAKLSEASKSSDLDLTNLTIVSSLHSDIREGNTFSGMVRQDVKTSGIQLVSILTKAADEAEKVLMNDAYTLCGGGDRDLGKQVLMPRIYGASFHAPTEEQEQALSFLAQEFPVASSFMGTMLALGRSGKDRWQHTLPDGFKAVYIPNHMEGTPFLNRGRDSIDLLSRKVDGPAFDAFGKPIQDRALSTHCVHSVDAWIDREMTIWASASTAEVEKARQRLLQINSEEDCEAFAGMLSTECVSLCALLRLADTPVDNPTPLGALQASFDTLKGKLLSQFDTLAANKDGQEFTVQSVFDDWGCHPNYAYVLDSLYRTIISNIFQSNLLDSILTEWGEEECADLLVQTPSRQQTNRLQAAIMNSDCIR